MIIPPLHTAKRPTEGTQSFMGSLWNDLVKPRIGMIVGGLVGGPIGLVAGDFAQRMINACRVRTEIGSSGVGLELTSPVSPTNPQNPNNNTDTQNKIVHFLDAQFKSTVQGLINGLDSVFNSNSSVNQTVINKVNSTLKQIAVLKAYAARLKADNSGSTNQEANKQKGDILQQTFVAIEKMILDYLKKNTTSYKVVVEEFTASNTNKVGAISLDWQRSKVQAFATKYIVNTQATAPNEIEVEVINTSPGNTNPATTVDENQIIVVDEEENTIVDNNGNTVVVDADNVDSNGNKVNYVKAGLGLLIGYVVVKSLVKQ